MHHNYRIKTEHSFDVVYQFPELSSFPECKTHKKEVPIFVSLARSKSVKHSHEIFKILCCCCFQNSAPNFATPDILIMIFSFVFALPYQQARRKQEKFTFLILFIYLPPGLMLCKISVICKLHYQKHVAYHFQFRV